MFAVWEFLTHPAVCLPLFFVLYVLVGGALFYVMGQFIVKVPKATFRRSVIVSFVAAIVQVVVFLIMGMAIRGVEALPLALLLSVVVSACIACGIVGKMFCVSYGKSALAWLPLFVCQLVLMSLLIPSTGRAREPAKRVVCKTRLKGLGTAMELYHQEYEVYPPSPKEFVEEGYASPKNFICPSDAHERDMSYFYLPPEETDEDETFVMCDFKGNHENYRNVLRKKDTVEGLSEEEFQAELAKPHNARFAAALKKAEGP